MRKALLISMTLVTGTISASADQAGVNPPSTTRFGSLRAQQRRSPYADLFKAQQALTQAVQQESTQKDSPKRRVVCGMTVVEASPALDPKMAATPPKDDKVRHTIRAVEPPVCWSRD